MPAEWFLVQYTHDLRRHEPRNVGVVVKAPDGWHLRFLGEREGGSVDGKRLKGLRLDRELYESWIDYYRRQASADTWDDAVRLQERRPNNFAIAPGGIQLADKDDWPAFATGLFTELVSDPTAKPSDDFDAKVRKLLRAADLHPDENVELEGLWTPGGAIHKIKFDFGFENGRRSVIEKVPLRDSSVYSFKGRRDAVQLRDNRTQFVAISEWSGDDSEEKLDELLHPLEEIADTINLRATDAVDQLHEALSLRGK